MGYLKGLNKTVSKINDAVLHSIGDDIELPLLWSIEFTTGLDSTVYNDYLSELVELFAEYDMVYGKDTLVKLHVAESPKWYFQHHINDVELVKDCVIDTAINAITDDKVEVANQFIDMLVVNFNDNAGLDDIDYGDSFELPNIVHSKMIDRLIAFFTKHGISNLYSTDSNLIAHYGHIGYDVYAQLTKSLFDLTKDLPAETSGFVTDKMVFDLVLTLSTDDDECDMITLKSIKPL